MNRLLLLLLLLSGNLMAQQSDNALLDVPARTNEVLRERASIRQADHIRISQNLLGKQFQQAKNNNNGIQEVIQIQSGRMIEVCVDTTVLTANFASLNDLSCTTLTSGSVSIMDNCFTFSAAAVLVIGRDTLCVELCDVNGDCTDFIYPIEIRAGVTLPFFEDWSTSVFVTDEGKWQDSKVFINNTIGIEPPTFGVATFDGIDQDGAEYGGGDGPSDQLTSTFINLDALSPASNVFFSYWIQPQGHGDRPEVRDSMVLEFRQEDGTWETVESFQGVPADSTSTARFPFNQRVIQLVDNKYFFDGFQFRFTNYSSNQGAVDNWHIDYITLDQNSTSTAPIDDVALSRIPDAIIEEYTAMPWRHFIEAPELLRDSITVGISNLSDIMQNAEPRRFLLLDLSSNSAVHVGDDLLDNSQRIVPAQSTSVFTNPINNYTAYQNDVLQAFGVDDTVVITSRFAIDPSFENTEVINNNIVERATVFDNYFAYDDGSAETNFVAQNNGTQFAVEFNTYVEDSLRAVSMRFNNVTTIDITQEFFNIRIFFDDLNSEPVLENILLRPILNDTLQGFTTYSLRDPNTDIPQALYIPANQKFFIAIQTASANPVPVGFDRNSIESADRNYVGLSGGWFPFPPSHQGAVMLRAVFGNETPATTSIDPEIESISEVIQVFPNPTDGRLTFIGEDIPISSFQYIAYNTLGQIIQQGQLTDELDFSRNVDGVYYLKLIEKGTQKVYNHKFILSK